MPKRNVNKKRLEQLIKTVVSEITIEMQVNYEEAEQAVNQLIDLAGNAALALGLEDKTITLPAHNFEFSLTTKFIK